MKQWAALLGEEMMSWPGVTTKPMFGFTGFYRGRVIFAALPKTRGLNSPSSIVFKFRRRSPQQPARLRRDTRVAVSVKGMAGWQSFELGSAADLKAALAWLDLAYRAARPS